MQNQRSNSDLSLASPMAVANGSTVLYSYWRSSCSWRVRIALYFKGIPFDYRAVNLLKDEQNQPEYVQLNSGRVLPTLLIDNQVLTQSVAILEYLEERRPETWRLMPLSAVKRAKVRSLVQLIVADIQPVQNLRILQNVGDDRKKEWSKHWITKGFEALETALQATAGTYCVGDEVSLADVCLVPQVYNARRFDVDMEKFPLIGKIDAALSSLEPFQRAHPDAQPDAVKL